MLNIKNIKIKLKKHKLSKIISLNYFFAFILTVFSFFSLYQFKPMMPVYYFYIISLLGFIFVIIKKTKLYFTPSILIGIIFIFYVLSTLLFQETDWKNVIHTAAACSYFVIGVNLLRLLNKNQVCTVSKSLLILSLLYISAETYWRLTNPTMSRLNDTDISTVNEDIRFYAFKINSFIALDSNFVSIMTASITTFAFYMYRHIEKNFIFISSFYWGVILTFLTLSRAVIACLIISGIVLYFWSLYKENISLLVKNLKIKLSVFIFSSIGILILLIGLILGSIYFESDGSFLTKIELLQGTFNYIQKASLSKLFLGVGSINENIVKNLDSGAHNIISTYLLWYGLTGLILISTFWFLIFKETKTKAKIILLPIILSGFSLTNPGCHIFYAVLSLIYYFENLLPKIEKLKELKCQKSL